MLTKVVRSWGLKAVHRSMPHWDRFWTPDDLDFPVDKFVIIVRRPDFSVKSAYQQGHGDPRLKGWGHLGHRMTEEELEQWWWQAIDHLAALPNAHWVFYAALVSNPEVQLRALAKALGSETHETSVQIRNENEKWRVARQRS